jgi:hypothetical protein
MCRLKCLLCSGSKGISHILLFAGLRVRNHPEGPASGHFVTGFLGFPLSLNKCWYGSQVPSYYCVLLMQSSLFKLIKIKLHYCQNHWYFSKWHVILIQKIEIIGKQAVSSSDNFFLYVTHIAKLWNFEVISDNVKIIRICIEGNYVRIWWLLLLLLLLLVGRYWVPRYLFKSLGIY